MTDEASAGPATTTGRRVILHPRTASARRLDRARGSSARVRGFAVDEADVLDYVGAHRQSAVRAFLVVCTLLVGLLVATALAPSLGDLMLGPVPVLWLVLGPLALFGMLGVAVWHERRALRLEARWAAEHDRQR